MRRTIAKRLDVPLVLIHHLSRDIEKRDDKKPVLADLKWDGGLEQVADVVIMPYREDLYQNFYQTKCRHR